MDSLIRGISTSGRAFIMDSRALRGATINWSMSRVVDAVILVEHEAPTVAFERGADGEGEDQQDFGQRVQAAALLHDDGDEEADDDGEGDADDGEPEGHVEAVDEARIAESQRVVVEREQAPVDVDAVFADLDGELGRAPQGCIYGSCNRGPPKGDILSSRLLSKGRDPRVPRGPSVFCACSLHPHPPRFRRGLVSPPSNIKALREGDGDRPYNFYSAGEGSPLQFVNARG